MNKHHKIFDNLTACILIVILLTGNLGPAFCAVQVYAETEQDLTALDDESIIENEFSEEPIIETAQNIPLEEELTETGAEDEVLAEDDPDRMELEDLIEEMDACEEPESESTDPEGIIPAGMIFHAWDKKDISIFILGIDDTLTPSLTEVSIDTEEGLEALGAYTVESVSAQDRIKLQIKIHIDTVSKLAPMETVSVYEIVKGKLGSILAEDIEGKDLAFELGGADGFAVVKDTGLRRKNVEVENVSLSGMMPIASEAEIADVTVEYADFGEETVTLAAYDISIVDGVEEYQPDEDHPIAMEISDPAIAAGGELELWHVKDDGTAEKITEFTVEDGKIRFDATGFSVYVVQQVKLERILTDSDGQTYKVTVTCDANAGIPADAVIETEEISDDSERYLEYVQKTAKVLGMDSIALTYAKLLDISIVDKNDPSMHYQPQTTVYVTVELLTIEETFSEPYSVVHFGEEPEELEAVTDGNTVSFSTDGFSAYAIVTGPNKAGNNWMKLTTMEELAELGSRGLYVGHTSGYYFTNETYKVNDTRTGIRKTKPKRNYPTVEASPYYFEPVDGSKDQFYAYCYNTEGQKRYVISKNSSNSLSLTANEGDKTVFTIETDNTSGVFLISNGDKYWNMQGGENGNGFAIYDNGKTDNNAKLNLWYSPIPDGDPYMLDGKNYGIMGYSGGVTGKALQANPLGNNALEALALNVMEQKEDRQQKLFVPKDTDATMWTFTWVQGDQYYLSANVGGSIKYLKLDANGVYLSDTPALITVEPGTGGQEGMICIESGLSAVTFSGLTESGFTAGTNAEDGAWLNLVEQSELTSDYFIPYSARKVSVSDTEKVTNGSRIIVYTRVWNEETKKYEFYAIDHDGSLVRCYENGDHIQWLGAAVNTLLWNFVEYYEDGTGKPNYYYELYNQYARKFIAPQIENGQFLSDDPIGINLNGRRHNDYYTTILAWDDPYYAYAGLKAEDGQIISCPYAQADDFYFAIVEDMTDDDTLLAVPTVDHTQYGVTMKLVDFGSDNNLQNNFLGSSEGGAVKTTVPDLLSTDLKENGYPKAKGGSLSELFQNAREVNHLFIESTYSGSGYYEFDSTQNFATLQEDGNFRVYKQLGTTDLSDKSSLKHGQFFPFDDLEAGRFASVNGQNLYDAILNELSDADPRKYEQMYLVSKPNYYFGVEIEAGFVQTPSGLDAWGHDVIYEFTGDDDFWLYVDGELVIDLGGIHSALPGSVNYRTGEVNVNGNPTTLYKIFKENYEKRNQGATTEEVNNYLNGIFEKNENGQYVFKDYTTHTMKIFYMERGAGASNLHMRFNLSSVKPGQVILNKQISGTEKQDYKLAEYAYQIYYQLPDNEEFHLLGEKNETNDQINVTYQNTSIPVKFMEKYTPVGGREYKNVFFLNPSQTVAIDVPDNTIQYKIVECGVNTQVYDEVYANDVRLTGQAAGENRMDYETAPATIADRQRVAFVNHVSENAARTLTITKRLYDAEDTEIKDDPTGFSFRLYLDNENATELTLADMQDYHVKDSAGNYCRWDAATQRFVSIGVKDYGQIPAEQKTSVTFQASSSGAISRIPAGYSVEVRDLLIGTKFKVEERSSEIPAGYSLIKYERAGASYIVEGDTVNSGIVRDNDSPAIEIHNRRGFGLTVNKVWSDESFMENHGDIYFAVYVKDSLLEGSVRRLRHPATSVYYYWDTLAEKADTLADYTIREVTLTGSYSIDGDGIVSGFQKIQPLDNGGLLTVAAKAKEEAAERDFDYTVSYATGLITGAAENIRTDTITNTRRGIRLMKQDWRGRPLAGASFTLTDSSGLVGAGTYTSDAEGLITIAYVNVDTVYTLTETRSPGGYQSLKEVLSFELKSDGTLEVTGGSDGWYEIIPATENEMASLIIKNRPFRLEALVQTARSDGTTAPLSGVGFELRREVTVDGRTIMDYSPIPGYEKLISADETGVIPSIDQTLPAGAYYLIETETLDGYEKLQDPIRFSISESGEVLLSSTASADLTSSLDDDGTLVYTIRIRNVQIIPLPAPTGSGIFSDPYIWIFLTALLLLAVMALPVRRKRRSRMRGGGADD